jgi:hypothetical protein
MHRCDPVPQRLFGSTTKPRQGTPVPHMTRLERRIRQLTMPVNKQYPRPWMSDSTAPNLSRVFLVGFNQAMSFERCIIGSHDAYIDALFNRNGHSIRQLYERARSGKGPSPTRQNIDCLSRKLAAKGIGDVLETNVICYSSPTSRALENPEHVGGTRRGEDIFVALLDEIRPQILITHGQRTRKRLERFFRRELPKIPQNLDDGVRSMHISSPLGSSSYHAEVFLIPSLAPPGWNRWAGWAPLHFVSLCEKIAQSLQ